MGHLSPVCDSSRMIACRASLRDARRKINFRIAGRNYLQGFKSLRKRSPASRSFEILGAERRAAGRTARGKAPLFLFVMSLLFRIVDRLRKCRTASASRMATWPADHTPGCNPSPQEISRRRRHEGRASYCARELHRSRVVISSLHLDEI
jgi:hypothetical protein